MHALAILAAGLLPVLFLLRAPFFRLPLHIDTGFYVSNHTVRTRRFRYARGWNARFAACSKVLPELFYSAVFLVHGGPRYRVMSRVWLTVWLWATAVVVGLAAARLSGDPRAALAGVVVFALVSSEPRYGIYFESAEPFELPLQALGTVVLYGGLQAHDPWTAGAGIGIWAAESLFVKLSSLPATALMALGAAVVDPRAIGPIGAALAFTGALWLAWAVANGARPWALATPVAAHERYFGRRLSLRSYAKTLTDKLALLARIVPAQPVVPLLALVGAVAGPGPSWILLLHLGATFVAHLFQAALVWYYAVPLLVPLALLAARGVVALLDQGAPGVVVLGLALVAWMAQHLAGSWGMLARRGLAGLSRHVWAPHGHQMADKNLALEAAAPRLRELVGDRSLFVFGLWNQAYVMVGASWETSLVSAARWLDDMMPGWVDELNRRLVESPPEMILDTDGCLDDALLSSALGLDYEVIAHAAPRFRLLRFTGRRLVTPELDASVRLYQRRPARPATGRIEDDGRRDQA